MLTTWILKKLGPIQVVWMKVKKLCFYLLQAGKHNGFTTISHNFGPIFKSIPVHIHAYLSRLQTNKRDKTHETHGNPHNILTSTWPDEWFKSRSFLYSKRPLERLAFRPRSSMSVVSWEWTRSCRTSTWKLKLHFGISWELYAPYLSPVSDL